MKPRVLVISFSDLARDPRVNRQIRALSSAYAVTACGFGDPQLEGVAFVKLAVQTRNATAKVVRNLHLLSRHYETVYWSEPYVRQVQANCNSLRAEIIVANDIETLPVALQLAQNWQARVVFDAHEYAPKEFEDKWRWRLLWQGYKTYLCQTYIPRAARMMTVSPGVASAYQSLASVNPTVVFNAPDFEPLEPQPIRPDQPVRMVHHGGALPSRHLEEMIAAFKQLSRPATLDFYLTPSDSKYLETLKSLAHSDGRIQFRAPVPMRELPRVLSAYDVGIYLLAPVSYNNRFALPNKFFEFVQARLAVAIGPSPDMAKLAQKYGFGAVSQGFSADEFSALLSGLEPEQINRMKLASHRAAGQLCAQHQGQQIVRLVEQALERKETA